MTVKGDDLLALAHHAVDVAHLVDEGFVKTELLHLLYDALCYALFLGRFAGDSDQLAQERCHILFKIFGFLKNF